MKRILSFLLALAVVVLLGSCQLETKFTFRDQHFGDTIEQVKASESGDGEIGEISGYQTVKYQNAKLADFIGNLTYLFKDNKLKHIFFDMPHYDYENKDIKDVYNGILVELNNYGIPDKETKINDTAYKALWEKNHYGIVLIIVKNNISITFSADPGKSEIFYNTLLLTKLMGD